MTVRAQLDHLLEGMPEDQMRQILDFARFLNWRDEQWAWRRFGQDQFARAYGPDEPDYTEADLKPERNP